MKHTIECIGFRPLAKTTLVSFAKMRINELKLAISDATLHSPGEARWAGLPAEPQIGKGATTRRDNRGQIAYAAILEFASRDVSDRLWSA